MTFQLKLDVLELIDIIEGPEPVPTLAPTLALKAPLPALSATSAGTAITLRDYQSKAVASLLSDLARGEYPVCDAATGCHALGQGVLMFDGTVKRVEDIVVGDRLMGPESNPRRVLRLCRGHDDMYDIVPIKGPPWRVNGEHLLTLVRTNRSRQTARLDGSLIDISVQDYVSQSKTFKHLHKLFRVSVEFGVQDQKLPLDPYCLGLFLGDGNHAFDAGMMITNSDPDVRRAIEALADEWGLRFAVSKDCRQVAVRVDLGVTRRQNPITHLLREWGFFAPNKAGLRIPLAYKTASIQDRLQLLAGLIDTDGSLAHGGYDFISKSKQLADDVAFLSRSVGLASTSPKTKYVNGYDDPYWRLSISGDNAMVPCRVPRKKANPREQIKSPMRTGFSVLPSGTNEDFFGFTLDGDGRYLLDDFTVTHNSGKSLIIAALAHALEGRILIVTHRKELIEQNANIYEKLSGEEPGIYSAGLGFRDRDRRVTFAGVASIHRQIKALQAAGKFAYVMVDECHRVTPRNTKSMYSRIFDACNQAQRIGLSATPYRLQHGSVYGDPSKNWFTSCPVQIGMQELVIQGYLSKLSGVRTAADVDVSGVSTRLGEYTTNELSEAASEDSVVNAALDEIVALASNRKSWLIFCVDVKHTQKVTAALLSRGIDAAYVVGTTPADVRKNLFAKFKSRKLRALVGCEVFTTGFDATCVDVIGLLRPSWSKSLIVQICGRGARLHPGKKDCIAEGELVLTDRGLVPIEQVTYDDRLWDGLNWVAHDGVICRGEQEVITYAGLTATLDHRVWTQEGWRSFGDCASQQIPIIRTANGRHAIRERESYLSDVPMDGKWQGQEAPCICSLRQVQDGEMDFCECSIQRQNKGLQAVWQPAPGAKMALPSIDGRETAMRESQGPSIQRLWQERYPISVSKCDRRSGLGAGKLGFKSGFTNRSHRQQWALCKGKYSVLDPKSELIPHEKESTSTENACLQIRTPRSPLCRQYAANFHLQGNELRNHCRKMAYPIKQTKRFVWDILNAGPLHRFTASGLLVSNCLILDCAGNLARHVPLDEIPDPVPSPRQAKKEEDEKKEREASEAKEREAKHRAGVDMDIDPFGLPDDVEYLDVKMVYYSLDNAKDQRYAGKTNLIVDYHCTTPDHKKRWVRQWLCVEYPNRGKALQSAKRWYKRRGMEVPTHAAQAKASSARYPKPSRIAVVKRNGFDVILAESF